MFWLSVPVHYGIRLELWIFEVFFFHRSLKSLHFVLLYEFIQQIEFIEYFMYFHYINMICSEGDSVLPAVTVYMKR